MTQKEIIKIMKEQFVEMFIERLDDIEFEYEEDGEFYYNILADGRNYIAKVNMEEGNVYWDKYLTKN